MPTMTTEETLAFFAALVLPSSMGGAAKAARVREVLAALGLSHTCQTLVSRLLMGRGRWDGLLAPCSSCLPTVCATPWLAAPMQVGGQLPGGLLLRGLSGGERKRLSIAAGIIATPSVVSGGRLPLAGWPLACSGARYRPPCGPQHLPALPARMQVFLDEPTSGLDSFAALTVMGHLKRMASVARQVVLASIHQPRSAIWSMFDSVSCAGKGGGAMGVGAAGCMCSLPRGPLHAQHHTHPAGCSTGGGTPTPPHPTPRRCWC